MSELAGTLSKLTLVIAVKTGEDGKMFGSVTAGTIVDELQHQYDAHLEKRKVHLPHPLKSLGEHEVELHLHPEVKCTLKVRIDSSTPLSPEVQEALAAQKAAQAPAAEAKPAREPRAAKGEGKKADKGEKAEKPEKKSKAKA